MSLLVRHVLQSVPAAPHKLSAASVQMGTTTAKIWPSVTLRVWTASMRIMQLGDAKGVPKTAQFALPFQTVANASQDSS